MKSKALIAELQRLDPSGEIEVCLGNSDILAIERLPAWYDGRFSVRIDPESPWYPKGYRLIGEGEKIRLQAWGWRDILWDIPSAPILIEPPSEHYEKRVASMREKIARRVKEIEATP